MARPEDTELTARGFQGVSDLDLINARLQGAARRAHEREARIGLPKPQSDVKQRWQPRPVTRPGIQVDTLKNDRHDTPSTEPDAARACRAHRAGPESGVAAAE